ncbi:MAG: redoxin domain-containing protein [Gammaproteobacteria bacterium]|nr:redoxin domain-containing protein [Gammaproteobacteria bacterium]
MPNVFSIGPFLVSTSILGLLLSLFSASWVVGRYAKHVGLEVRTVRRIMETGLLIGIVGARLAFVVLNWESYRENLWTILFFWQPGYLPAAGLISGVGYAIWQAQKWAPNERLVCLRVLGSGAAVAAVVLVTFLGGVRLALDSNALRAGDRVPEFVLKNLEGKIARFSDLRGQTVILNFWATWCPPCRREMPLLENVYQRNRDRGLTIVGVALDEPADLVTRFVDSMGITYPIWVDDDTKPDSDRTLDIYAQFGETGLPTTLFVGADGVIQKTYVGELSRAFVEQWVRKLVPAGVN